MIYVKCLEKIRNKNGSITQYKLIDTNNKTMFIESDELKKNIIDKKVFVVNLKLTIDNKLIDRPASEIEDKIKANIRNLDNKTKTLSLLSRLIDGTILTVLRDHGLKYDVKYSKVNDSLNKVYADIRVPELKLYKVTNYRSFGNSNIEEDKTNENVITVELERKADKKYEILVYNSLSKTDFCDKVIPELKHKFIIDTENKTIQAEYKQKEIKYDFTSNSEKLVYNTYVCEYKSIKESLADVTDYFALWVRNNILDIERLPKHLTDMNKVDSILNSVYNLLYSKGLKLSRRPELNKEAYNTRCKNFNIIESDISFSITGKENYGYAWISLKLELNKYRETKVNAYINIHCYRNEAYRSDDSIKVELNQSTFEKDFNKNISAEAFLGLVIEFAKDYLVYSNYIPNIVMHTIEKNLSSNMLSAFSVEYGALDSLDDTNKNVFTKDTLVCSNGVKLGFLNNYLYNNSRSIRFYIKLGFKTERVTRYYGVDVNKSIVIGITLSKDKVTIGDIQYKLDIDDDSENSFKVEPLANKITLDVNYEDDYNRQNIHISSALSRKSILKKLNMIEIKLNKDILKKLNSLEESSEELKGLSKRELSAVSNFRISRIRELTSLLHNLLQIRRPLYNSWIAIKNSNRHIECLTDDLLRSDWFLYETDEIDHGCILLEGVLNKDNNEYTIYSSLIDNKDAIGELNNTVNDLNKEAENILKEIEHVKYMYSAEGMQDIYNKIKSLKDMCKPYSNGGEIYEYNKIEYFNLGLSFKLVLTIADDLTNYAANIMKVELRPSNSDYTSELDNEIYSNVKEIIKDTKENYSLTLDTWYDTLLNIITYITGKLDEERLRIGLMSFNNQVENVSEEIEKLDDEEFNWL